MIFWTALSLQLLLLLQVNSRHISYKKIYNEPETTKETGDEHPDSKQNIPPVQVTDDFPMSVYFPGTDPSNPCAGCAAVQSSGMAPPTAPDASGDGSGEVLPMPVATTPATPVFGDPMFSIAGPPIQPPPSVPSNGLPIPVGSAELISAPVPTTTLMPQPITTKAPVAPAVPAVPAPPVPASPTPASPAPASPAPTADAATTPAPKQDQSPPTDPAVPAPPLPAKKSESQQKPKLGSGRRGTVTTHSINRIMQSPNANRMQHANSATSSTSKVLSGKVSNKSHKRAKVHDTKADVNPKATVTSTGKIVKRSASDEDFEWPNIIDGKRVGYFIDGIPFSTDDYLENDDEAESETVMNQPVSSDVNKEEYILSPDESASIVARSNVEDSPSDDSDSYEEMQFMNYMQRLKTEDAHSSAGLRNKVSGSYNDNKNRPNHSLEGHVGGKSNQKARASSRGKDKSNGRKHTISTFAANPYLYKTEVGKRNRKTSGKKTITGEVRANVSPRIEEDVMVQQYAGESAEASSVNMAKQLDSNDPAKNTTNITVSFAPANPYAESQPEAGEMVQQSNPEVPSTPPDAVLTPELPNAPMEQPEAKPGNPTEQPPQNPTEAKPDYPTEQLPQNPTAVKPDYPTEQAPQNPTEAKPDYPTEQAPQNPTAVKPDYPTEQAPQNPTAAKPDYPIVQAPENPTEVKLDYPTETNPDSLIEAKPDNPIEAKPDNPIEANPMQDLSPAPELQAPTEDALVTTTKAPWIVPDSTPPPSSLPQEDPQLTTTTTPTPFPSDSSESPVVDPSPSASSQSPPSASGTSSSSLDSSASKQANAPVVPEATKPIKVFSSSSKSKKPNASSPGVSAGFSTGIDQPVTEKESSEAASQTDDGASPSQTFSPEASDKGASFQSQQQTDQPSATAPGSSTEPDTTPLEEQQLLNIENKQNKNSGKDLQTTPQRRRDGMTRPSTPTFNRRLSTDSEAHRKPIYSR